MKTTLNNILLLSFILGYNVMTYLIFPKHIEVNLFFYSFIFALSFIPLFGGYYFVKIYHKYFNKYFLLIILKYIFVAFFLIGLSGSLLSISLGFIHFLLAIHFLQFGLGGIISLKYIEKSHTYFVKCLWI